MKLTRSNTTALVIDLQEKLVPAMSDASRLAERSRLLLSGLAIYDVPIVVTRQYPKGLGDTLPEIKDVSENATIFDKTTFSCLDAKEIRDWFVADSRRNVVVAGIEAHICVLQTALDLLEMGKRVYLAADCVSSRNSFDQQFAFERLLNAGVIPTTAEAILFEIANRAGSPEFKALSKLVTKR